jgi:WhiB family redox-sensing transcriptional regulator
MGRTPGRATTRFEGRVVSSLQKNFLAAMVDNPPPCTEEDPEIFFGGSDSTAAARNVAAAKAVCRTCPLIFACLQFALETNDQFAIMGGKTPNERARAQSRYNERQAA